MPFCVVEPVTAMFTVAESVAAVPHAPPTEVAVALVVYGNVRAVPFSVVSVTPGAVASTVIVEAALVPVLPAASAWVAVTEYTPSADSAVAGV